MVSPVYPAYPHPWHSVLPALSTRHLNELLHISGLLSGSLAPYSVLIVIPYRCVPSLSIAAWCNLLACDTQSGEAFRFEAMVQNASEQRGDHIEAKRKDEGKRWTKTKIILPQSKGGETKDGLAWWKIFRLFCIANILTSIPRPGFLSL